MYVTFQTGENGVRLKNTKKQPQREPRLLL